MHEFWTPLRASIAPWPPRFPDPFAAGPPHPLARAAGEALMEALAGREDAAREGKMFGVLVVETPDGARGFLRAFSGQWAGRWHVPGFAPPLFDAAARVAVEAPGEAAVKAMLAAETGGSLLRTALEALTAHQAAELTELRDRHAARRAARHARRAAGDRSPELDAESRADKAEVERLQTAHRAARLGPEEALRAHAEAVTARQAYCRTLMQAIHDTYRIRNAIGQFRALRDLYAGEPPSGAGDCAAPKLLGLAYASGLRPVALAELWWGPPPADGSRRAGHFYPPCRARCGPLLPFMLEGLPLEASATPPGAEPPTEPLRVVYEDRWLIAVAKPAGLLSTPGREAALADSVESRLGGPKVVHRLDLDTSGLLLAARDATTLAAMQRQFAARKVQKRYVAWVVGTLRGDRGRIELALRGDPDDRPRQIHDPVHGKPAVTEWVALTRVGGRTRVAFTPLTGRTHQLRVHAAHPAGLDAPIVGDRLYGRPGARLMLHAEGLAFTHPATGAAIALECPAPF